MFTKDFEDRDKGLYLVECIDKGPIPREVLESTGTAYQMSWLCRDEYGLHALRRGLHGRKIFSQQFDKYPIMVTIDLIVSDDPKPTSLNDVSKRSDIDTEVYVASALASNGTAVNALLHKLEKGTLKMNIEQKLAERKDIVVTIDGHNCIDFNTYYGWLTQLQFTVSGDVGLGEAVNSLVTLCDSLEPVPHQNLADYEPAVNDVKDVMTSLILKAVNDFKATAEEVEVKHTMLYKYQEIVVFSIKVTPTEAKFNESFLN